MAPLANTATDAEVEAYLREQEGLDTLRFITCGSVDDGKSTLIGRLLYDSKLIFDDHLAALEKDSRRHGTVADGIDFALLVDGLQAEREQGITIDVAYRFFATPRRRFIVADTPGHEQYTRNMATGASTADLAVILIDARKGILTQTRRHSFIVSLMGIRQVVLAVNKMDLVGWDQGVFESILIEYKAFASGIGLNDVTAIPVSALKGENLFEPGPSMPWYQGPTLIQALENAPVDRADSAAPFRMPVQWVNRPDLDFRGFTGHVASGRVAPGDRLVVLPSGKSATVKRLADFAGDKAELQAGEPATIVLAEEIDIARGDMLSDAEHPADVSDQIQADLIWMADEPLLPERQYRIQLGPQSAMAAVTDLRYSININTMEHVASKALHLNEVGVCNLSLDRAIAFDPYQRNRQTGSFILIDRYTNQTLGAGMIRFGLRRATNLTWQALTIDKAARAAQKGQKPAVLWFTGLSGAGKSTIADLVEKRLLSHGKHTYLLDGDNIRHGLNRDLGFTDADRVENIRRVAEVAKLMADAGLIVLTSFISPFKAERDMARALMAEGEFLEIHVDTALEACAARDPKGLYAKAKAGLIKNFTGIDSPYEAPDAPELRLDTATLTAEEAAEKVLILLKDRGILN